MSDLIFGAIEACFGPVADFTLTPLSGGLLNEVYRAQFVDTSRARQSVVVKHTTPYIASVPHIALDSTRRQFAITALQWVQSTVQSTIQSNVRTPTIMHVDDARHCIIFEDLGDGPDLQAALLHGSTDQAHQWGTSVGFWLGQLHGQSWGVASLAQHMNNHSIQKTRFEVQYNALESWWTPEQRAKYPRAAGMARAMGLRLWRGRGSCLIMGDLWLASVLVRDGQLVVIDWEMSHFGQPGQDVGHLLAHLRLMDTMTADTFACAFMPAYFMGLKSFGAQWEAYMFDDANRHMGMEMLTRTIGAFASVKVDEARVDVALNMVDCARMDPWFAKRIC